MVEVGVAEVSPLVFIAAAERGLVGMGGGQDQRVVVLEPVDETAGVTG